MKRKPEKAQRSQKSWEQFIVQSLPDGRQVQSSEFKTLETRNPERGTKKRIKQAGCNKKVQFLNYLRKGCFPDPPPLEGLGEASLLKFFGMLGKENVIMQIIT